MSNFNLSPKAAQLMEAINKSNDIAEIISSIDRIDFGYLSESEQDELRFALGIIDRHLHTLLGYFIA